MIKQTQTKLFASSDVGLDFCAGSINKFPEVFKKILVTGFNPQTVNSVNIVGSTVTLTYGVTHGYVADRVLQVTASGGFNKQVYIDSVNGNNVICTVLDGSTTGLTGTINTKVAPLGWGIVYEVANIHVYKMKHIDDTDMYVRMCFQNNTSQRNAVAVCIGKTWDSATGFITDENAFQDTKDCMQPLTANVSRIAWNTFREGYANESYSSGYSEFGLAMAFVGSPYHLGFSMTERYAHNIFGIFPKATHDYAVLDYPVLVSQYNNGIYAVNSGNFAKWNNSANAVYIGNIRCSIDFIETPTNSFLPATIDSFNTTTLRPFKLSEINTGQHLGYMYGLYFCMYSDSNRPAFDRFATPLISTDVDFENLVIVMGSAVENYYPNHVAFVVEEIKHGI